MREVAVAFSFAATAMRIEQGRRSERHCPGQLKVSLTKYRIRGGARRKPAGAGPCFSFANAQRRLYFHLRLGGILPEAGDPVFDELVNQWKRYKGGTAVLYPQMVSISPEANTNQAAQRRANDQGVPLYVDLHVILSFPEGFLTGCREKVFPFPM